MDSLSLLFHITIELHKALNSMMIKEKKMHIREQKPL